MPMNQSYFHIILLVSSWFSSWSNKLTWTHMNNYEIIVFFGTSHIRSWCLCQCWMLWSAWRTPAWYFAEQAPSTVVPSRLLWVQEGDPLRSSKPPEGKTGEWRLPGSGLHGVKDGKSIFVGLGNDRRLPSQSHACSCSSPHTLQSSVSQSPYFCRDWPSLNLRRDAIYVTDVTSLNPWINKGLTLSKTARIFWRTVSLGGSSLKWAISAKTAGWETLSQSGGSTIANQYGHPESLNADETVFGLSELTFARCISFLLPDPNLG